MPFTRYSKYLFIDDEDSTTLVPLGTDVDKTDYYLSNELVKGFVPQDEIEQAIRSPILKRYTRFFLLHDDETIIEEISDMVLDSGNIEKNAQTGQTRSMNITLANIKKKVLVGKGVYEERYLWTPTPFENKLWYYNKIKVVSGIVVGNTAYEVDEGIFVMFDPNLKSDNANKTVSTQLYDKFALLDGTISGKENIDYEVPLHTNIHSAVRQLIRLPKNKMEQPYDFKDIIYPPKYKNEKLAYTIKKTGENAIGPLITDIAKTISCDVKYDTQGQLNIVDSLADLDYHNRKLAWKFKEGEFTGPSAKINRSKIKNQVTVKGANVNGYLSSATVENTNPLSNYNINSEFGIKGHLINDNLISGNFLCRERARYELKKFAQQYITIDFQCIYIPHLEPGDIVEWSYPDWGINHEIFLVNSVSIPIKGSELMNISITNINELPL